MCDFVLTNAKKIVILQIVARYATERNKERTERMNTNKLKGKIVEKGMNVEGLANLIGVDRSSLYRKLNNAEKITVGEAMRMKNALEMSNAEAYDIFFG